MLEAEDPVETYDVRDDVFRQHQVELDVAKLLIVSGHVRHEAVMDLLNLLNRLQNNLKHMNNMISLHHVSTTYSKA